MLDKILIGEETFNEKMDNLILAVHGIGAGQGGDVSITTWKQVQQLVRAGLAPKYFAIGDQLIVNKESAMSISSNNSGLTVTVNADVFIAKAGETGTKDYEATYDGIEWHDEEGNDLVLSQWGITVSGTPVQGDHIVVHETATQIAFDIIGFDCDTPEDTNFTHSMTLQAHNVVQSIQFDASELLHYVKDNALPAGTYKFTLLHGMYGGGTSNDGDYVFTTTQPIPVGGGFRINAWGYWESSYDVLTKKIFTYDASGTKIEECSITAYAGETSTDLGKYSSRSTDMTTEELTYKNSIEKQGGGDNYYLTSGVRQWLNSDASAGNWWSKQNVFQLPNGSKASAGFMKGIDPSFLAVLGKAVKTVKSDTVWYNDGEHTFADKFFLLSNKEVRFTTYNDEGCDYPYWTRLIPTATNDAKAERIKTLNGSATYWWTRTAFRSLGNYECYVEPTGALSHYNASYTYGVVPACVIV